MFSSPWRSSHCSKGSPWCLCIRKSCFVSMASEIMKGMVEVRNKAKQNETNQSNRAALILTASEEWEVRRHGCHRVSNGGEWFLREKGIQSWNQEPRAMDRRTALMDNCLREGHSCPRHCFWIKEAGLTSFLAKLSLPTGSVTDGRELPISSCPLSFVFLC